jgi:hypothetical protein
MKISGPLFKWFGSKWLSAKQLPPPTQELIIEPFAGSAGYALRHHERDVLLYEADDNLRELWEWLIAEATQQSVLDIPLNLPEGKDVRTIGLSRGQALLLKSWQRTNSVGNCWTISKWGNLPGQWTASTRARIAEEFAAVSHWKIGGRDGMVAFNNSPATWFVDPPYVYNYRYRRYEVFRYLELADKVKRCKGQVIVCEATCQKTGAVPDYLPFDFWQNRPTSRRKAGLNNYSRELIYVR